MGPLALFTVCIAMQSGLAFADDSCPDTGTHKIDGAKCGQAESEKLAAMHNTHDQVNLLQDISKVNIELEQMQQTEQREASQHVEEQKPECNSYGYHTGDGEWRDKTFGKPSKGCTRKTNDPLGCFHFISPDGKFFPRDYALPEKTKIQKHRECPGILQVSLLDGSDNFVIQASDIILLAHPGACKSKSNDDDACKLQDWKASNFQASTTEVKSVGSTEGKATKKGKSSGHHAIAGSKTPKFTAAGGDTGSAVAKNSGVSFDPDFAVHQTMGSSTGNSGAASEVSTPGNSVDIFPAAQASATHFMPDPSLTTPPMDFDGGAAHGSIEASLGLGGNHGGTGGGNRGGTGEGDSLDGGSGHGSGHAQNNGCGCPEGGPIFCPQCR